MKKIILTGLLVCGFYAQAGMGDSYINVEAGVSEFSRIGLEDSRIVLSYGMNIESGMSYAGFFEVGIKAPVALASLKYGYEFMRDDEFSFGVDIAVLIGIPGDSLRTNRMNDIALGNEVGVFVKMEATNDISVFVRGGVLHETPINYLNRWQNSIAPFADIGIQYNL
ncbi:MAG: hypothetical protein OXK80_04830 [Bdellovibrionales bacterium]|nr:hypothetical protein [Bdellovibrionales bacterium]